MTEPAGIETTGDDAARADIDLDAPCVLHLGPTNGAGYGNRWRKYEDGSTETLAHRVAWRDTYGPIPAGMTIDHLCRNKVCINVLHMEVVTRGENTRRAGATEAAAAAKRAATGCKRGHPFDQENTYIDPAGRRGCRACRKARSRAWYLEHKETVNG